MTHDSFQENVVMTVDRVCGRILKKHTRTFQKLCIFLKELQENLNKAFFPEAMLVKNYEYQAWDTRGEVKTSLTSRLIYFLLLVRVIPLSCSKPGTNWNRKVCILYDNYEDINQ